MSSLLDMACHMFVRRGVSSNVVSSARRAAMMPHAASTRSYNNTNDTNDSCNSTDYSPPTPAGQGSQGGGNDSVWRPLIRPVANRFSRTGACFLIVSVDFQKLLFAFVGFYLRASGHLPPSQPAIEKKFKEPKHKPTVVIIRRLCALHVKLFPLQIKGR